MTPQELAKIKERVAKTLSKRKGIGAVDMYAGQVLAVPLPVQGEPMKAEVGKAIIEPLLKITGDTPGREYLRELGGLVEPGEPVAPAFTPEGMERACDILDADVDDEKNRGTRHEVTHCAGACTGICTGMCFGMCMGCTGCGDRCSSSCGSVADIDASRTQMPASGIHERTGSTGTEEMGGS